MQITSFLSILAVASVALSCEIVVTDVEGTISGSTPCTYYFQAAQGFKSFWAASFVIYSEDGRYTFYDGQSNTSPVIKSFASPWDNPIQQSVTNLVTSTGSFMTLEVIFQSGANVTWNFSLQYTLYQEAGSQMIGLGYTTPESTGEITQELYGSPNGVFNLGSSWVLAPPCAFNENYGIDIDIQLAEYLDTSQSLKIVLRIGSINPEFLILTKNGVYNSGLYWPAASPGAWDSEITVQSMVKATNASQSSFKLEYDMEEVEDSGSSDPPADFWTIMFAMMLVVSLILLIIVIVLWTKKKNVAGQYHALPAVQPVMHPMQPLYTFGPQTIFRPTPTN